VINGTVQGMTRESIVSLLLEQRQELKWQRVCDKSVGRFEKVNRWAIIWLLYQQPD